MVELAAAHWVFALFIALVLVTMALRRKTPLICIRGMEFPAEREGE